MWNSIPRFIRDAPSLQSFKNNLKKASGILNDIIFEKEASLISYKDSKFLYF